MDKRFLMFIGFTIFAAAMVFDPLRDLMDSAERSDYYSHIILIPCVTAYLMYSKKKDLLGNPSPSYGMGGILALLGLALYALGFYEATGLNLNDQVALFVFSAVVFWAGGYLLLFGLDALRRNSFPFLFLVFMIPIPNPLMSRIIYALQWASTEVSEVLFFLIGVPYQREGFVFHLPGISVEVAEVCSGIRSSLALFITSILAGHFFLDRLWKKAVLAVVVFPVTVFKNGVRIITLSLLGVYVDPRFLTGGFLHQSGGFLFFIPALGILGFSLWALRREGVNQRKTKETQVG